MKCYFCNQTIPYNEVHHSQSFQSLRIGDCLHCKNDTVHATMVTEGEKLVSAHLYVQWGEKRYQFLLHIKDGYFAIIHLTSNKSDGRDEIYKIEEIPDINFDNILNKLPLYLTFL
jgi:hypothetical protein